MLQKKIRSFFLILGDILLINLALLLTLFLHYEGGLPGGIFLAYGKWFVLATLVKIFIYNRFGLYGSLWAYASIEELMKIVLAVSVSILASALLFFFAGISWYMGIYLFYFLMELSVIGGLRFSYRLLRRVKRRQSLVRQGANKKTLIIGSGSTASLIATEIKNHPGTYGQVVGFIDDDPAKYKKTIAGIKVLGNRFDILSICKRHSVDEIIIALPRVSKKDMQEIIRECEHTLLKTQIVPSIAEVIDGQVSMSEIRDVEIDDLLGRDAVDLNVTEIASYVEDKVVMVTGGGGSIGSELCRQIARFKPGQLIILDIYENNAYDIQNELKRSYEDLNLDVVIASVRDRDNILRLMKDLQPDVIFHAAAHKHVPLMERMPKEAVKNNTFGTMNVAEAALAIDAERFVLISTDKAVNPTNIMGASKRMCELVVQGLAAKSKTTTFAAVRFGNVLGSNGSVIPLFKRQIEEGGPVTVTHKEIIRYFMTIPEAAQLVIQAGAIAQGGEVFVLDMGEPVKIYDLARELIRLSGFKPEVEIPIQITGLRPGEKLYEELLMNEEGLENTKYEKIYIGKPQKIEYSFLRNTFNELRKTMETEDCQTFIEEVRQIVPTYKDSTEVNKENKHLEESSDKYHTVGVDLVK